MGLSSYSCILSTTYNLQELGYACNGHQRARHGYIEGLLQDVLAGELLPGRIFDKRLRLEEVAEAYRLMDRRSAIKVLLGASPL
jgi:Threonine dehydrogenase and related Zn-dependent dehydrogenases